MSTKLGPLVLGRPVQLLVDQRRRPLVGQGEQGLGVVAGEVGVDPGAEGGREPDDLAVGLHRDHGVAGPAGAGRPALGRLLPGGLGGRHGQAVGADGGDHVEDAVLVAAQEDRRALAVEHVGDLAGEDLPGAGVAQAVGQGPAGRVQRVHPLALGQAAGPGPVAQEGQADGHDQQRQQRLVVGQQGGDDQAVGDAGGPVGGRHRGRPQPALHEPLAGGEADHGADQRVVDQEEGGHGDDPDHGQGRPEDARLELAAEQVGAWSRSTRAAATAAATATDRTYWGTLNSRLTGCCSNSSWLTAIPAPVAITSTGGSRKTTPSTITMSHTPTEKRWLRSGTLTTNRSARTRPATYSSGCRRSAQGLPARLPDGPWEIEGDDDRGRGHDRQDEQPGGTWERGPDALGERPGLAHHVTAIGRLGPGGRGPVAGPGPGGRFPAGPVPGRC